MICLVLRVWGNWRRIRSVGASRRVYCNEDFLADHHKLKRLFEQDEDLPGVYSYARGRYLFPRIALCIFWMYHPHKWRTWGIESARAGEDNVPVPERESFHHTIA